MFFLLLAPLFAVIGFYLWTGEFWETRGLLVASLFYVISALIFFIGCILVYRLFLTFFPLSEGHIPKDSSIEFHWMVYMLFWLFFFNPIFTTKLLPVPLTRILYLLFGCKIAEGTYFSGTVLDPQFVQFGARVIVDMDSKFSAETHTNWP